MSSDCCFIWGCLKAIPSSSSYYPMTSMIELIKEKYLQLTYMLKGNTENLKYTGKVQKNSNYFRVIPPKKKSTAAYQKKQSSMNYVLM